jgi:uncharacterized protein
MIESTCTIGVARSFLTLLQGNRAGLWTTILGALLIVLVWQQSYVFLIFATLLPLSTVSAHDEALVVTARLLAGFAPALIVIVLWRRFAEGLSAMTLVTAMVPFRWRLAIVSGLVVGSLGLVITLMFDLHSAAMIKERLDRFSATDWLLLTGAYGLGIVVQASFEEVLVRGWLMQHIRRLVPNVLGVILITAVVFAAMHFRHHGWATYLVTFAFGLAFGWSVFRLNGLEAAIGAHVGNNLVGALLAGQMITPNPPTMDSAQFIQLAAYVLGFLLFVEVWVRFFDKPSRA